MRWVRRRGIAETGGGWIARELLKGGLLTVRPWIPLSLGWLVPKRITSGVRGGFVSKGAVRLLLRVELPNFLLRGGTGLRWETGLVAVVERGHLATAGSHVPAPKVWLGAVRFVLPGTELWLRGQKRSVSSSPERCEPQSGSAFVGGLSCLLQLTPAVPPACFGTGPVCVWYAAVWTALSQQLKRSSTAPSQN